MTCEATRKQLVAYRDGELRERDRARVVAHLSECATCSREEAQLARVRQLVVTHLERITPSAQFATTFWQRLAQEGQIEEESRFVRWWREWMSGWQLVPVLAGTASLLVFLGYLLSGSPQKSVTLSDPKIPTQLVKQPEFFVNYPVIANFDKLAYFDEIASVEQAQPPPTAPDHEEDLPPQLLENPSFFVHYPILKRMEQLQNFDAVLSVPPSADDKQMQG